MSRPFQPSPTSTCSRAIAGAALAIAAMWARPARADTMVIERPGYHSRYTFEAEPHLLLGLIAPGPAHGQGIGAGFRGTIKIVENGFIPKINNSVGIGFGVDFAHFGSSRCERLDNMGRCAGTDAVNAIWVPVVLQWNFYISRNWSVFGEPGVAIRFESRDGRDSHTGVDYLHLYLGGRYHFTDNFTLTMRVGFPTVSVGVSFLI